MKRYRYERKFLTTLLAEEALREVRLNPGVFRRLYPARQINNIYFDTKGLGFYYDNIEGVSERVKVRIRWYGQDNSKAISPVLELKKKSSFYGEKEIYSLPDFKVKGATPRELAGIWNEAFLPTPLKHWLLSLHPVIFNSYLRDYFISADGKFRLTLDDKMKFCNISPGEVSLAGMVEDYQYRLFELKYDTTDDPLADKISGAFPFRMTKNSKYLRGVELTCL